MSASLDDQLSRAIGLLRAESPGATDVVERLGNADAWLVRHGPDRLLLKRGRPEQDEADVTWEHDHLRRLQATDFPTSVPITAFGGRSWALLEGRIWATLTYLPGRPLASEPDPDMEAAGAFLARYHRASRRVSTDRQRPTASGLRLREVTPWDTLRAALGSADALDLFAGLLDDLEAGLHAIQYSTLEHLVIHGHPTNDNLLVDGSPPRIVGLIDFGAASLAPWPADLAAGLWRSGRAVDTDIAYDLDRITRFGRGYHRESAIPRSLAATIPILIQARGLALISRRVRRFGPVLPNGVPDYLAITLARAAWACDHRNAFLAAADAALHDDA